MTLTPYQEAHNMWYRECLENKEKFSVILSFEHGRPSGRWFAIIKGVKLNKRAKSLRKCKILLDNKLNELGYKILTDEEWSRLKVLL